MVIELDDALDSRLDFFVATDQMMARTEGVFNKFGWIPFAGCVTGSLRFTIGKIMVLAGIFMAAFKGLEGLFSGNSFHYKEAKQFAGYALHGFMNQARAVIEWIPFVNTVVLVSYDRLIGRFSYGFENERFQRPALIPVELRI